ncbi:MAG TPA: adenylate/guanylate cyclase domain-containing protein [Acidimicrobiia bacterium]|nr:adenylate/guanylate cyclase domain-containing protein [Acidimicrobiia bacterium]
MDRKLSRALRRLGATPDEIERAGEEGWLTRLAVDKTLLPGSGRYDMGEIAELVGIEPETGKRLWRALGFPDLEPNAKVFTDTDVRALVRLEEQRLTPLATDGVELEHEAEPENELVEGVRIFSAGLARVAAALTDQLAEELRRARATGLSDEQLAMAVLDQLDWESLSALFDYTLRLQSRDMLRRKLANVEADTAGARVLSIGFVDLVGYTALSQMMSLEEVSALVRRFETLAFDTVAQEAGRVVKTIGDEVMFVALNVASAARIARRITDRSTDDDLLPLARAGLAYGLVVARDGDYFGPVVNLASRLVEIARPASVIVSDAVHEELVDEEGFAWKRLRPRRLRDIGRVEMWALAAVEDDATDAGPGAENGSGTDPEAAVGQPDDEQEKAGSEARGEDRPAR